MAPSLDRVRVRLVQIRTRPGVLAEERASFQKRTGLAADRFLASSALDEPITTDWLDGVDAVMIGGAGAYSVTETYDWTPALIDLCHACADRQLPLFGSCWGHQFVARAFGGEVVHDPTRAELGTHTVSLTDAGRRDPLFSTLPTTFGTQMGHHDRVARLPDGAVELAANGTAPYQAFRLGDAPIYGTQFHSELDAETERQRLVAYRAHYPEMADDGEFDAVVDALYETPEADDLLRRFLLLYAVDGGAERTTG
ncbi:type 1 glutamine amidotransferase [Rubrivirga sp. IMCC45206]|uniref:type 1 glutamine amidotransferase n=1 Tax=Rubrivirga sp. IMCC45206 TaxID=3391614 RepID=UPI00398FABD8